MESYSYLYEDGCLVILEGNELFHMEYIEEFDLVEDTICELQEQGILPCIDLNRVYC